MSKPIIERYRTKMQKRPVSEWHTVTHSLDHAEPPWDWLFRVVIPGHSGLRLVGTRELGGDEHGARGEEKYQYFGHPVLSPEWQSCASLRSR